jgi:outer membrane protein assembly factor BamB
MAFDNSSNFYYTGSIQYWEKPLGLSAVYFVVKGGGGGGNSYSSSGGGGGYVFTKFSYLNPDISYNVMINVGGGGQAPPTQLGGQTLGGTGNNNGGNGTTLNGLQSGGGGGMSSVFYMDTVDHKIIEIVAGGGGGAGNNAGTNGGDGGRVGSTGSGAGAGQGGNTSGTGNAGQGGVNGGANGFNYIDSSLNGVYTFIGGGGGGGGTFAGGGGGSGYGGGAGGRQGGGGGGGSFSLPSSFYTFLSGKGGAGGGTGSAGGNGSVQIYWVTQPYIIPPPIVNQFMLNVQHTNKSPYVGATFLPPIVYTSQTSSATFPNAGVISGYNIFYTIAGDGTLYAFNEDLSLRWSYKAPTNYVFFGTPLLITDGTMYIAGKATRSPPPTPANCLFAVFDAGESGMLKWQMPYELDGNSSVSPILDLSGTIYIGTDKGSLYAVADGLTNGLSVWPYPYYYPFNGAIIGTPVFDIYYSNLCFTTNNTTSGTSTLYVLNITNNTPTLKWTQTAQPNEIYGTPSIDSKNILYVPTSFGNVYGYDISNNGEPLWPPVNVADISLSSIAVGNNNQLYCTSQNGFNVIDSSAGSLEWVYPIGKGSSLSNSVPTIDANNNVYFGGRDNYFLSIDPVNRKTNWQYKAGGAIQGIPIISNNLNLYFGATDGKIYDFSGNGTTSTSTFPIVPMYMLNPQHTGNSPYYGPSRSRLPTLKWPAVAFVSGNLYVSPAISIDASGILYLGSNNGRVYALNSRTGNAIAGWPVTLPVSTNDYFTSPNAVYTTPVISPDGTIYVGSNAGYLFALTPSGTLKWKYTAGYPLQSSPMIDNTGSIYFGAGPCVYSIGDAGYSGYPKWLKPFQTGGNVNSSPALGANGYLYFGSDDGYVYAVDRFTGLQKWSFSGNDAIVHPIYTSCTVDASNNVIVGNGSYMEGVLYYLDGETGTKIWQQSYDPMIGPFYNTVAVKGNRIYLSTIAYVYIINRLTGDMIATYCNSNCYYTSAVIDASGTLYIGSIDASDLNKNHALLHSFTDTGTELIENWRYDTGVGRLAPPVLGNDGTLYLSSTANAIYALH